MHINNNYEFTNDWFFQVAKANWDNIIPTLNPKKILEIGSHEGQATTYLIEKQSLNFPIEVHCIDPWEDYDELLGVNMQSIENRFDKNIALAKLNAVNPVDIIKHKETSDIALSQMMANGKKGYFDFIYVDGAHKAPEVLFDAVVAFQLLRIDGIMAFDDYLWHEYDPKEKDLFRCPKPAIDAFINIHWRKLNILSAPLYQKYIKKISN